MNFYKRNLGDYAKDTADLDALEHGIYNLLMDYYYATEKPLPDDMDRLIRISRVHHWRQHQVVKSIADRFFPVAEDGLRHHKRIDHECELLGVISVTNSRVARERWKQEKANEINGSSMRNASETHGKRNATPDSTTPDSRLQSLEKTKKEEKTKTKDSCSGASRTAAKGVWESYRIAYSKRYHTDPVRNAKVNGQITQFCQRVPIDEAADIAAFYVNHNAQFYVLKAHPVGSMLADAEKLHTEWITGNRTTNSQAQQADKLQGRGDVWKKFLVEAEEEREKINGSGGVHV